MLRLQLLGACSLRCGSESLSGPAVQPRRLAFFALAAGYRHKGLSRDKVTCYFWPEEERERARHFLADSLFTIRKSFGRDIFVVSLGELRLNPERITADLWDFEDAVARNDCAAAVAAYGGDFLDGFFITDAPEFERWVDAERERLRKLCCNCVESLATDAERRGNYKKAAEHWLDLAVRNPYSAEVTLRAMTALAKSGDAAAAVRHASKYEKSMREDLEISPDPEVMHLAQRIRSGPCFSLGKAVDHPSAIEPAERDPLPHERPPVVPIAAPRQQVQPSDRFGRWQIITALLLVVLGAAVIVANIPAENGASSPFAVRLFLERVKSDTSGPLTARARAEALYHRARLVAASEMWPGPLDETLALYQEALRLDPTFARAYAGIADLYDAHGQYDLAKDAALKAIAIDSTLPEAYTALAGPLAYSEHRWGAADSALDRATRLDSRYKLAWMRRAYIAAFQGRNDDALVYLRRAAALDPDSWLTLDNTAIILSHVGRLDESIDAFQQAMRLEPARNDVKTLYGRTLWKAGRRAEAIVMFRASGALIEAAVAAGDTTEMKQLLHRYLAGELKVDPCRAAMLYLGLGNRDEAFRELRKSRHIIVPRLLKEPPLISLSDDPRYGRLLADWKLLPDSLRR